MLAIVIYIVVFIVIFAIIALLQVKKSKEAIIEKFVASGYTITKQDNYVIIDENNQKWVYTMGLDMPIMDFSDITDIELVEGGIKYKSENGVLRAITGGALFGTTGAIIGGATANRSQKATEIYVLVYTKNMSCPTVRIYTSDRQNAERLVGIFNIMRDTAIKPTD